MKSETKHYRLIRRTEEIIQLGLEHPESRLISNDDLTRFRPCAAVNSLLITWLRAAGRLTGRTSGDPTPLFRASSILDRPLRGAQSFEAKPNQLVGVCAAKTPIEMTFFGTMVRQITNQMTNLRRRFLRKNAGARTKLGPHYHGAQGVNN